MKRTRLHQVLLLAALVWLSWLGMMLAHETGHVLAADATGGQVQKVVWHPLALSRTDVNPNPCPRIVVWLGPVLGVALPLAVAGLMTVIRPSISYLFIFFAGACLIANGAYIAFGTLDEAGDAGDMIRLGTPLWLMWLSGLLASAIGLWLWHLVSPKLGFGKQPQPLHVAHTLGAVLVAAAITALGFALALVG